MRLPRFFGKKRGHRRTGSKIWGSLGDALFHGALLLTGVVFAGLLITGVAVPEWRINHHFIETRCTILGKGLLRRTLEDPPGSFSSTWQPTLRLRYDVAGDAREAWSRPRRVTGGTDRAAALDALTAWEVGAVVTGWYDPADARTVVLERGYNWWMWLLALLLPGALLAFGGAGLLRASLSWGKSEEHRAATGGIGGVLGSLAPRPESRGQPGLPGCENMTDSPGTIFAHRLPMESPEHWILLGFGLFAVLWNAVLVVLAVGAGLDLMGGRTDWLLFALLVPFLAIGVTGVVLFIRRLVLSTAVGTTQVEVSTLPLRPGDRCDMLVAQSGSGSFRRLDVLLELEEHATFTQGTDTRSDRVVVRSLPIHAWSDVTLSPGTRFEGRAAFTIPADAMHSFVAEHNALCWRIVVRGAPTRWPRFTRTFPVVVHPAASAADARVREAAP